MSPQAQESTIERTQLRVSVVITCYNQARFIAQAIESVLLQTYPLVAITVVDDGSTDHTEEIVRQYAKVRYIRQKNQGVVRARNRGLRESDGDCLVFLDGDDRFVADALETQVKCLSRYPECGFVAGQNSFIAADGTPLTGDYFSIDLPVTTDHYEALLRNNFIRMPAMVMYRRSVFDAIAADGFRVNADHSSDYEIYLRFARSVAIHCHGGVVAEYRVHDANSTYNSAGMLEHTMKVHREQRKYVLGNKRYEDAYREGAKAWQKRYGEEAVDQVRQALQRGGWRDWQRAIGILRLLLVYSPGVFKKYAFRKIAASTLRTKH